MAEQIDLSVALTTSSWRVRSLTLTRGLFSSGGSITLDSSKSSIQVTLIGENGKTFEYAWTGSLADADIVSLNKVNLSTTSLNRRIINKLIADGVIVGTASGTPD